MSQLAPGADQIAAAIALEAGCESVCVLPLELERYRERFASDADRTEFERLLAASSTLALPQLSTISEDRAAGYALAGHFIAKHAAILLAVWDGIVVPTPGSTADVIRVRRSRWIGTGGANIQYLPVARDGAVAYNAQVELTTEPQWDLTGATQHSAADPAQLSIDACDWAKAEEFNAAVLERAEADGPARVAEPFDAVTDEHIAAVAAHYDAARTGAAQMKRIVRRRQVLLHLVGLCAGVAFILIFKAADERWLVWLYLGLLTAAMALKKIVRREAAHRRHLDYRCLAEALRVALYWRIAGVHSEAGPHTAALRLVGRQDESLRWIGVAVLGIDGWLACAKLDPAFNGCEFAARHWIGRPPFDEARAQIPYYRAAASQALATARLTDRVANAALWSGIAAAAALAISPQRWMASAEPLLKSVMGVLPLVSGTASSVVDVGDQLEVAQQYRSLAGMLTHAQERLQAADSDAERRQVLFEVGTAMLAEQRVWHTILSERVPGTHQV